MLKRGKAKVFSFSCNLLMTQDGLWFKIDRKMLSKNILQHWIPSVRKNIFFFFGDTTRNLFCIYCVDLREYDYIFLASSETTYVHWYFFFFFTRLYISLTRFIHIKKQKRPYIEQLIAESNFLARLHCSAPTGSGMSIRNCDRVKTRILCRVHAHCVLAQSFLVVGWWPSVHTRTREE